MSEKEKLALLEETMEVDAGSLAPEIFLSEVDSYDSMSKLSILIMMEDEFGKKLNSNDIKGFKTVQDILNCMEA